MNTSGQRVSASIRVCDLVRSTSIHWKNSTRVLRLALLLTLSVCCIDARAQSPVTATPAAINFGNQFLGRISGSKVVTITNTQSVPVQISRISVSGGNDPTDYSLGIICPLQKPLAAGQSCTVNVRLQPTILGTLAANLVITENASNTSQTVALTGVGMPPIAITPASVTFPAENLGTTSGPGSINVANHLNAALSISSISASGDFAVTGNTCGSSIPAAGQCNIAVSFTPIATGLRTGTLQIADSAFGSPHTVALSGNGTSTQGWANLQHVIIIFQENRSTDNLFQDPVLIARGADIASSGLNSLGQTIPLTPIDLGTKGTMPSNYDMDHSHKAFLAMYDGGKMDGADKVTPNCGTSPCPPNPGFRYVLPADVAPYFQLAEQFTFGDRMFQTNRGPSFPAHQFIISGTSAPTATSPLFMAGNIAGGTATSAVGCIAPPSAYTQVLDPMGKSSNMYPCAEHPALTDLLEAAGVNWRYYTPTAGSLWTGPNGIQHICGPNLPPPNATACTGADWNAHVVLGTDHTHPTLLQDIAAGTLAPVSWVMPNGTASDHAGMNDGSGPSWVASIVNAIGASPYWSNTAIIITWDDWGGWYDHVPPPQVINDGVSWGSGYLYGFRVPLIVVSPYARPGYISHVNHDFGSILNLVERVFDLPSLGYADARADDLSDCFDFTQAPISFRAVAAPIGAKAFASHIVTPVDPDDD